MVSGITYRIRKGVRLIQRQAGCLLTADFPLGAIRLSPVWSGPLGWVKDHPGVDFSPISQLWPDLPVATIGIFLHRLTLKGFLVEEGVPDEEGVPAVSVIIPVRNRPEDLERCLLSLREVRYSEDKIEIIVIDDASTDQTADVATAFGVTLLKNVRRRGASFCRNLGASRAGGSLLCFIDSDCVAKPDWLVQLVANFRDETVSVVGGMVGGLLDRTALDRYEAVSSLLYMGDYCRDSRGGGPFFYLPTCNMAVRRDVFLAVGGCNESMEVGEDVDLCWRIIDAGGVIEYCPAAVVLHRHRNQIGSFTRRRFDYGTSEPLLQALHPNRRKTLPVWPGAMLFWTAIAAGIGLHPALFLAAVLWFCCESLVRGRQLRQRGVPYRPGSLIDAGLRQHVSILYHLAAFFSRYYLLPGLLLFPLLPAVTAILLGLHFGVGATKYYLKQSRLNFIYFLFFFFLEEIAYQAGVWTGCTKKLFFWPVAPKIMLKKIFTD